MMIEQQTEFSTHNPSLVGDAFPTNLVFRASFSARVNQFDTVSVNHAEERRICHENLGEMLMAVKQVEQSGSFGQIREQRFVIVCYPSIEGSVADAFEGKEQGDGNHFRGIEIGLAMLLVFLVLCEFIINTTEQMCDKIDCGHESRFPPVNQELSNT